METKCWNFQYRGIHYNAFDLCYTKESADDTKYLYSGLQPLKTPSNTLRTSSFYKNILEWDVKQQTYTTRKRVRGMTD